jgi:THAP4-like, heme-binding beta-barrel domain
MATPSALHGFPAALRARCRRAGARDPIGVTEVAVGTVEAGVIELRSIAVSLTPTASPVTELRRRIDGGGDVLSFELHVAMEGVELLSHVRSRLACA